MYDALLQRDFRTSSEWDLIEFARLEPAERTALAERALDDTFFGVLRHRANGRSLRAVDRDTALLLLSLARPGPLPNFARNALAAEGAGPLAALVMDGILEVAADGEFRSGSAAADLFAAVPDLEASAGRLACTSRRAVRSAAALRSTDRTALQRHLYAYDRMPLTRSWRTLLPDAAAVLAWTRLDGSVPGFQQTGDARTWITWMPTAPRSATRRSPTHKLYISPWPDALPDVLPAAFDALRHTALVQVKMGADATGLLRPDKVVAYFDNAAAVSDAAERIAERIAGTRPHGVPFTAEIAGNGLLSWGSDPPPDARPLSWLPADSWRTWITGRVAGALVDTVDLDADAAHRFALQRLSVDGIDVDRWIPSAAFRQGMSREA